MFKTWMKKYGILAAAALVSAISLQGCYIDGSSSCYTYTDYVGCRTECDFYSCWDACDEVTKTVCEDDDYYDRNHYYAQDYHCRTSSDCGPNDICRAGRCLGSGISNGCASNSDCGPNSFCENSMCKEYKSNGNVIMCGACNVNADCAEVGAMCTQLNNGRGERVCTRRCEAANDCPTGFTCTVVKDYGSNTSSQQCIPNANSCDSSYCTSDRDCNENADCINNQCIIPTDNLHECRSSNDCMNKYPDLDTCVQTKQGESYCTLPCYVDEHCAPGYRCYLTPDPSLPILESGLCRTIRDGACQVSSDCESGLICRDGKCAVTCATDADCRTEQNAGFRCMSGVCM